ncbi:type III secretion system translocon subunit SctB [Lampropedia aestuarii]|uniref:type III secretion system translocon subunit SctB n=1 Tax=Lampropedia aestuarii TaxID=2562762 RepID=UPI0024699520|nr:type III secretion system translocon subunit SctB [Lampropedia aestuarii]MDH5857329.1 type III secretion system translocon subunit SctB [Lampropedia aestuarii]
MSVQPPVIGSSGGPSYVDFSETNSASDVKKNGVQVHEIEQDNVGGTDKEKKSGVDMPAPELTRGGSVGLSNSLASLTADQMQADIYAVMALFQKMAQEQRTAARETRMAEAEAQTSSLMAAADEIRSAAKDRLIGGVISGSLSIVGGAVSMVGAAKEARALSRTADPAIPKVGTLTKEEALKVNPEQVANKAAVNDQLKKDFASLQLKKPVEGAFTQKEAFRISPEQAAKKAAWNDQFSKNFGSLQLPATASGQGAAAQQVANKAAFNLQSQSGMKAGGNAPKTHFPAETQKNEQPKLSGDALAAHIAAEGKVWQGAAQTIGATGGLVSSITEFTASQHDARKAELEAQASAHDAAAQQANDVMQQMQDIIRDIRDKLGAMEQSSLETNRSIARNI